MSCSFDILTLRLINLDRQCVSYEASSAQLRDLPLVEIDAGAGPSDRHYPDTFACVRIYSTTAL